MEIIMTNEITLNLEEIIHCDRRGTYFTIPFSVEQAAESLEISYNYEKFEKTAFKGENWLAEEREKVNTIDLGLINPLGEQVGTSGSEKSEIFISETWSTPGYQTCPILPGEWRILVGVYRIAGDEIKVSYTIRITPKSRRWLKGDTHCHTLASDGVHSAAELACKAKRNGLDFIVISDHNQFVSKASLPIEPGLTIIPGVEWTHYRGHANFLGCEKPYDGTFAVNSVDEVETIFKTAHERGALISINHPFESGSTFDFDLNKLPYDCLEIWNGPRYESNLKALGFWQSLLAAGVKIPAIAGSDYHRDTPLIFLGGPTTCVLAESNAAMDILAALRAGRSYFIFSPEGPGLELETSEGKTLGESQPWFENSHFIFRINDLKTGDIVRVVSRDVQTTVYEATGDGDFQMTFPVNEAGFYRLEVLRAFSPDIPRLPALLSNPVYFDA